MLWVLFQNLVPSSKSRSFHVILSLQQSEYDNLSKSTQYTTKKPLVHISTVSKKKFLRQGIKLTTLKGAN